MDRHNIKEFILSIEDKFPVDKWNIDGIDVWPIIRIKISFLLIYSTDHSLNKQKRKTEKKKEIKNQNSLINRIKTHRKTKVYKARLKLLKLKKVDFLFGTADTQRAILNGTSYNKFSDPLMEKLKNKSLVIEHSLKHLYNHNRAYKKKRILYLYDVLNYILYSDDRRKRLNTTKRINLPEHDKFIEFISSEKSIKSQIDSYSIESIVKLINRFQDFGDCYNEILKRTKPKIVFTVCYYSFPAMALNYVANKKGITTIEIQHGPQYDSHMAYASWKKIPKSGFNTLPKVFWNWDKYSNNTIHQWTKDSNFHTNFIGGNPWIDFLNDNQIKKEKNIILYSLQNLKFEHLFPDYIIESIKTTNFKWWVRLHPRQLEYYDELSSFLKSKNILDLVNIKEATDLPLPLILNQTKVHITNHSGCTIEAANYNVPTIIINELGKDIFKDLIEEKIAFYAQSQNEFNSKLSELLLLNNSNNLEKEKINYSDILNNYI